jgi:hypothetical protein
MSGNPENENENIYDRIRREAREKEEKRKKEEEIRQRQIEGLTTWGGGI